MTHKQLEDFLYSLDEKVWLDYPFEKEVAVYKLGEKGSRNSKMFALIQEESNPLRISLKCDPLLAKSLRGKYETVLPGYHLNKKHWNTIICSGQLNEQEIYDLVRHSFELIKS